MHRHLPRLTAVISKPTFDFEVSPRDTKALLDAEARCVEENADTYGYCGCHVRMLDSAFCSNPPGQQKGTDVARLLIEWFVKAAEQEMVPLFITLTSDDTSEWANIYMEMGAEEVGTFVEPMSVVKRTGDTEDSDLDVLESQDGTVKHKFMMWKVPEESVNCSKE